MTLINLIMQNYPFREVISILWADGWYEVACVGDHHHFKHPEKKGRVTVPHPNKDLPMGTVKSIFRQAGITIN